MKTAVLIIDLQVGLFQEAGVPFDFHATVTKVNELIAYARRIESPVVFVQHEQPEGVLKYGTAGWDIIPEVQKRADDIYIRKTSPNSFLKTELNNILTQYGVKKIIVCGYATEFCVDSTVRGGAALGYSILIASDAHTTQDKPHASAEFIRTQHNETLSGITSFGVRITADSTEKLIQTGFDRI